MVEERECKGKDDGGDLPFCKGFSPFRVPVISLPRVLSFNNFFVQSTVCTHPGANGVHAAKRVFQGFLLILILFANL